MGQPSQTASAQTNPASSRATATLALFGITFRARILSAFECRRRLASAAMRAASGPTPEQEAARELGDGRAEAAAALLAGDDLLQALRHDEPLGG